MFWQKVSSKVGTRTAEECLLQHQGQIVLNKKDPSARRGFAKEKKDPGQKGTLHVSIAVIAWHSKHTKHTKCNVLVFHDSR